MASCSIARRFSSGRGGEKRMPPRAVDLRCKTPTGTVTTAQPADASNAPAGEQPRTTTLPGSHSTSLTVVHNESRTSDGGSERAKWVSRLVYPPNGRKCDVWMLVPALHS